MSDPMKRLVGLACAVIAAALLSAACDAARSEQKELVKLGAQRAALISKLYAQYGGSSVAGAIKSDMRKQGVPDTPQDQQAMQAAAGVIESLDQRVFEQYLLQLGSGRQPLVFTPKAQQFFARPDVRKGAMRLYEMSLRIDYLEKRMQARAGAL
jgi:hypothetical protein